MSRRGGGGESDADDELPIVLMESSSISLAPSVSPANMAVMLRTVTCATLPADDASCCSDRFNSAPTMTAYCSWPFTAVSALSRVKATALIMMVSAGVPGRMPLALMSASVLNGTSWRPMNFSRSFVL